MGCLYTFWVVLTMNFYTVGLAIPCLLLFSMPMKRAVGFRRSLFVLRQLFLYFPVATRALLSFLSVYALVLLGVFLDSLVDAREINGKYYVFTSGKPSYRIEITQEEYALFFFFLLFFSLFC